MKGIRNIILPLFGVSLVSCNGGGDFLASFNPSDTSDTGKVVGSITGFGSIFVNGVEYATGSASFTINDTSGVESELAVGQIVLLSTTKNQDGSLTVDSVEYDPQVRGAVSSIDLDTDQLRVGGQSVAVDGGTIYMNSSLSTIAVDDFLEVSGYRTADNSIRATFVARDTVGNDVEIKGTIQNLDTGASRFDLGTLAVTYTNAMFEPLTLELENGQFIDVKGTILGSDLTATNIELEETLTGEEGQEFEIEGLVQNLLSLDEFEVLGIRVRVDGDTTYESGSSADIRLDSKLEVTGTIDANGNLVAETIEFRPELPLEIAGLVSAVSAAQGSVTVTGVAVLTNQLTTYADRQVQLADFGIGDIQTGDWLEVRGYQDMSQVFASRIERDEPQDRVRIQAPIESISTTRREITLLGVTIDTSATSFDLNEANTDDLVQAEGSFANAVLIAQSVEPED